MDGSAAATPCSKEEEQYRVLLIFVLLKVRCYIVIQIHCTKEKADFRRSEAEIRHREAWAYLPICINIYRKNGAGDRGEDEQ